MKDKEYLIAGIVLVIFIIQAFSVFSDPTGATISASHSSRRSTPNATNTTAQGGNVTQITADLSQTTNIWQGYYGDVTGGILLADSDDNTFYDWNVVGAVGEILATRTEITDWSKINCTNQTEIYFEEQRLNITNATSDGINDTFVGTSHPDFELADRTMKGCRSTRTYNSTTADSVFWNVLLNANENITVYTVLLDDNQDGFNGTSYDFQMLVPVNALTSTAVYYIYVELG